MPRSIALASAAALALACTSKNPNFCESNEDCAGSARSFCDVDGAIEGTANACILPPDDTPDAGAPTPDAGAACATPDSFLRCEADTAVTCSATGTELREPCGFGCNEAAARCNECTPDTTACTADVVTECSADGLITSETPCPLACHDTEARCNQIVPSNGLAEYLDLAADADDVVLTDGAEIHTDTGAVTNGDATAVLVPSFSLPAPPQGVPVRVFVVRSFTAGDLSVRGAPAIAVVAAGDITLSGDLTFGLSRPGALNTGPCVGLDGDTNTVGSATHVSGGGGGGYREAGAKGGTVELAIAGGDGGAAFVNPPLVPLRGGCRGGGTDGGRGGGAMQLVSSTAIRLAPTATVNAGGQGGQREDSGGGSGGGILLEAPVVELEPAAVLAANGGGGACPQQPGRDATASADVAAGGVCPDPDFTDGGAGGAGTTSPVPGGTIDVSSTIDRVAGSGGGAAGYIRINTANGTFQRASDAIVSPPATTSTLGVN